MAPSLRSLPIRPFHHPQKAVAGEKPHPLTGEVQLVSCVIDSFLTLLRRKELDRVGDHMAIGVCVADLDCSLARWEVNLPTAANAPCSGGLRWLTFTECCVPPA